MRWNKIYGIYADRTFFDFIKTSHVFWITIINAVIAFAYDK